MVKSGQPTIGVYLMNLKTPSLLAAFIAVMLIACGVSSDPQQPPSPAVSKTCDAQHVTSLEAGNHIGQEITVCGEVTDYHYTNTGPAPTRLLFDQTDFFNAFVAKRRGIPKTTDAFSVIVWKRDVKSFPPNFGTFYSGKMICITGVVEMYQENPAIIASTSDQIKVGC